VLSPAAAAIGPDGWLWHCENPFKVNDRAADDLQLCCCAVVVKVCLGIRDWLLALLVACVWPAHPVVSCTNVFISLALQVLTTPDTALSCYAVLALRMRGWWFAAGCCRPNV
jgi:hypothetical protein